MVRRNAYYAKVIGHKHEDEPDEWNTGLCHDDPRHYWRRNGIHHTGLFKNQEILDRRKRIDQRLNRILNNAEPTSIIHTKNKWLTYLLLKYIPIGLVLFIGIFIFIWGLGFIFNNVSFKPKTINPPTIVEQMEDDQYSNNDDVY
jgi:hypothetical protein